jgi:hypothetical protein
MIDPRTSIVIYCHVAIGLVLWCTWTLACALEHAEATHPFMAHLIHILVHASILILIVAGARHVVRYACRVGTIVYILHHEPTFNTRINAFLEHVDPTLALAFWTSHIHVLHAMMVHAFHHMLHVFFCLLQAREAFREVQTGCLRREARHTILIHLGKIVTSPI